MRYNANMTGKIRIIAGFASPREVAKELGVSKTELRSIEDILNKPAVRKKSSRNRSGAFVTRRPLRRRPHQFRDGRPDLDPRQSGRSSRPQKRVRGTAAISQMRLKTSARSVFLNCPFDSKYENLYLALIAGATALGLTQRCVLEIPTTAARLTRLVELISQRDYSIHDLSRVQLSGPAPRCPRFNMPFELGYIQHL